MSWSLVAGLFFGYALLDGMYAHYTISVVEQRALSAAATGFAMHFLIAAGVLAYTRDFRYVLPLALGSFVGTYAVVKRQGKDTASD